MLHSLKIKSHFFIASNCHFVGVNIYFTDPGKDKELKSPAATKDKGNTEGQNCITPKDIFASRKKSCNSLGYCS